MCLPGPLGQQPVRLRAVRWVLRLVDYCRWLAVLSGRVLVWRPRVGRLLLSRARWGPSWVGRLLLFLARLPQVLVAWLVGLWGLLVRWHSRG